MPCTGHSLMERQGIPCLYQPTMNETINKNHAENPVKLLKIAS